MEKLSFNSGEHYHKGLQVLREKSGEFDKMRDILRLHLPPKIRKQLQTSQSDQFNVLSIGSGDGAIDLEVLQIVEEELQRDVKYRDMKIFNRAIEPNHHHLDLYKKAIENVPNKTAFDLRSQTFEQYTHELSSKEEPPTKFDLVHFIHSLYYVDVEQVLQHCLEKEVRENGQVLVVVEGKGLIAVLYNTANQHLTPELAVREPEESFPDQIVKIAVKNGWKYELFTQEYEIDVTEVFDEDSVKGNLLLDFCTHLDNFRATAEKAYIEQILSVVRDQTTVKDGKRLGKKSDVVLVITKC